ncbi:MAG: glycosyltransferase family 2 protein [Candidatus Levybacteria bacterium]|nr:glycosyltransferase family 2 protein [Candidatus Levybacteria bacterium]
MDKKKIRLSAVISVFNNEDVLGDCLKSVSFADETIVVNCSSTDKTENIAHKYTDRVFTRPNNPMLNINKNYGFSKAVGEWILCLDADERVTPELAREIKEAILASRPASPSQGGRSGRNPANGYWIPRKNIIFGKWIEHTGWYPDYQLRLFRNGKGKFPEKHVHEMLKVEGDTAYLKNNLLHYNYTTISQFLNKLNIYVFNEAEQLLDKGYKFKWQDVISSPAKEFLSRFFAREGYKDGFHGLMLSLLMSFYHLLVVAVIWEKKGFEEIEVSDFNTEIKKEFKKSYKDLLFWINNERLKAIKSPLRRTVYRIFRKLHAK